MVTDKTIDQLTPMTSIAPADLFVAQHSKIARSISGSTLTEFFRSYIGPVAADAASKMTDHNKVYIYVGNEAGYTSGNWYYWNGTAWTSGGVYNSQALNTDETLTHEGMAADAAATGELINSATHMKWDTKARGKMLFLGNSYGKNSNYEDIVKWPNRVAEYLELGTEDTDWFNVCEPAHSLYGTNGTDASFIRDLQIWVGNHQSECANIGAIVLVAGVNDARPIRYVQVPSCLENLAEYIKDTFPNAIMYNGYCGWINEGAKPSSDTHGGAGYRNVVYLGYLEGKQYGWNYLNGVEYAFHDKNEMVDHIHPNTEGEKHIGMAVANAILTGSATSGKRMAANIVPSGTTITIEDTTYTTSVTNGGLFQWISNGYIRTNYDSLEFSMSSAMPMLVNQVYTVGTVNLPYSNTVDFGNQVVTIRTDTDTYVPMVCRIYIQPRSDASNIMNINYQIRCFFDGETTKNVLMLRRIIMTNLMPAIAD